MRSKRMSVMPFQEHDTASRTPGPVPRYGSRTGLRSFLSSSGPSLPISHSDPTLLTDATAHHQQDGEHARQERQTYIRSPPSRSRTNTSSTSRAKSRRPTVSPHRERGTTSWAPPPLFQAHPQSILVANLELPCLPVNLILRMNDGKETNTREEDPGGAADEAAPAAQASRKKDAKAWRHQRSLSASISSRPWAKKIFILVTSGYLLQYSDGNQISDYMHDRLPEKVLQLKPQSVAFACDAIPGKPWVLQISQDADWEERSRAPTSKAMWSRLGFRSAEEKRMATDFLLVLESAEELKSWLTAVRKEIEALGGCHYRSGTADPKLEHKLSQRFQVRRDPNQFLRSSSEPPSPFEPTKPFHEYEIPEVSISDSVSWLEQSFIRRSLTGSSTMTATDLDKLRDSSWEATSAKDGRTSLVESNSPLSLVQERFSAAHTAPVPAPTAHSPDRAQQQASSDRALTGPSSSPDRRRTSDPSSQRTSPPATNCLPLTQDDANTLSSTPKFSLRSPQMRPSNNALGGPVSAANAESWATPTPQAQHEDAHIRITTRPVSTVAPPPDRTALSELSGINSRTSEKDTIAAAKPIQRESPPTRNPDHPPATVGHSRGNSVNKQAYHAFPKRYSSLEYAQNRVSLTPSSPSTTGPPATPQATSHPRTNSTASVSPPDIHHPPSPPRPRRPASLQLRKPHLVESAERSPAVTDAHFATNFGTTAPLPKHIRILDDDELEALAAKSAKARKRDGKVPEKRAGGVRKSSSVKKAPLAVVIAQPGPPPTCPLPEVPNLIRYHTRADRANAASEKWLRRNYVDT